MRFDDSLKTVLAADMSTGFGASAAWRQLVDLMGRGRMEADEPALARLRLLRQAVPAPVRAASARALVHAHPAAALVGLFAEDELAIAAPVLRNAVLPAADWLTLLPRLAPTHRAILRHRRDLPAAVVRGLESFGAVDFVIEGAPAPRAEPIPLVPDAPLSETPFVTVGDVARALPVMAEALRQQSEESIPPAPTEPNGYAISDLVARIDAFTRNRDLPGSEDVAAAQPGPLSSRFRYETDADGVVRWVEGVARAALVGLSFATGAAQGPAQVDGVVAGAFRRRSRFDDARLQVEGLSDAAGSWRVSGIPLFDPASGRFTGYHGTARRPRPDEAAEPHENGQRAELDSLRQLVHELRAPTNAIVGFAELIEAELLGPVSPTYRARAGTIRAHAADLVAAIEDLDTAARIEGDALELRPAIVEPVQLVERLLEDLQPLAGLRGTSPVLNAADVAPIAADDRAAERVIGRLLATAIAAGTAGERIGIDIAQAGGSIVIAIDRPRALATDTGRDDRLLVIDEPGAADDEMMEGAHGNPLLGAGFALRLARNLAGELGGSLAIDADRLTLRLPAAVDRDVGQTTTS